jgi:hypothetical protein
MENFLALWISLNEGDFNGSLYYIVYLVIHNPYYIVTCVR